MNGWQSLLDSETVKSRISYANKLHEDGQVADTPQEWHGSIENIISMCRGTGAVPVAATDSGEAQTVPRLTKRALVISRETCCDGV